MLKSSIRGRRVSLILAVLLLSAACGDDEATNGGGQEGQAAASEVTQLIPSPSTHSYFAPVVAPELGYYEQENLEVETVTAKDGSGQVVQQVTAGQVPGGWSAGTGIVAGYAQEPNLRVIACHQVQNQFRIVSLEDGDIGAIPDLEGKTLGVSDVAGGEIALVEAALGAAGLERDEDVEILPIGSGTAATINAVQSGRVQAYASSIADLAAMKSRGVEFRDLTPPEFRDIPASCLFTTADVLADEEKRQVVIGLGRAWVKSNLFAITNPEAAFEIICEKRPEECQNEEVARTLFEDNLELIRPSDADVQLGSFTTEGWEKLAQMLKDGGTIDEDVDITDLIEGDEVEAAQEEVLDFDEEEVKQDAEEF